MEIIPGSFRKPSPYLLVLVGGVVVRNDMYIHLRRHVDVNVTQKLQKLLMTMSFLRLSENRARGNVKSSEKG